MTTQKHPDFQYIPQIISNLLHSKHFEKTFGKTPIPSLYDKYWSLINFLIIWALGYFLSAFLPPFFSSLYLLFWVWLNTVGPLSLLWGFSKRNANKTPS